jgi:hypothetical protein
MSCPGIWSVQYRLTDQNGITQLKFMHKAMGQSSHDSRIERRRDELMARIRSATQEYSHWR